MLKGQSQRAPERREAEEEAPGEEEEDLGPCASRPMPRGWTGIYIQNGREDIHAFQYMHMGYEKFSADGRFFVVEFNINVSEKWRVTVHGRKLWPIFRNLHHHKLEWLKKADRDFVDDGRSVITGIVVEPVREAEADSGKVVSLRPEGIDEDSAALA